MSERSFGGMRIFAQAASEGTTVSFNARTQSAYTVIQGTIDRLEALEALEALDALDGISTAARPYNPFATAS